MTAGDVSEGAPQALPTVSTTWQKYQEYYVNVDPKQGDRSTELKLWSRHTFKRPHMRAFHVAWFGFFIAFTAWFSFAPLMPEIKKTLGLTPAQVYNVNIASISATVGARLLVGPLCDALGARQMQSIVLFLGGCATYFGGLANSAVTLAVIRFFVGILGATFVSCMYWTSAFFTREKIGLANATAAGWGNFGGGITHLFMIAVWNMFRNAGYSDEGAWRRAFTIPASIVLIVAFATPFLAEDSPKGNYKDLYKHGSAVRRSSIKSAKSGYSQFNSWVLMLHYACSFGMELTIINTTSLYFTNRWGVSTSKAGMISALFGCMNIWARSAGGFLSDYMFKKFGGGNVGMRGRIIAQFICLLGEGLTLILFATRDSLSQAAGCLALFSMFVAMANGSCYGIVPYVMPEATGAVSGCVGAGGNIGAICWSTFLRFGPSDTSRVFTMMGVIVCCCAFTTPLLRIRGHDNCLTKAKGEPDTLDVL